jgi:general secretion pathway protein M
MRPVVCRDWIPGAVVPDLAPDYQLAVPSQPPDLAKEVASLLELPQVSVPSGDKAATLGEGEFLTGKTDGAIGADLQGRLKGMVEAAGAKLRSVRNLQPRTDAQMRYIGSRIELFGPIAAIHRAIHAIESAKPYLFVTGGTIRLAQSIGQVGVPQAPLIEAQLHVYGAVRVEVRKP